MSKKRILNIVTPFIFTIISLIYISPIFIVLMNSFKKKTFINLTPFELPNAKTFVAGQNYIQVAERYKFPSAVIITLLITIGSVFAILLFTSMFAWYITRVNSTLSKILYILCVFSMVVPFQMLMFTLAKTTDSLRLGTPWGLIIIYLGFGAGLAVFMFCGFVKSIPLAIEEASRIDGCNPLQTFFLIVVPVMKSTYITVGILETMWIWNDFLLPYLTLDRNKFNTISMVVQNMQGSYGRVDMGAIMAALVLAMLPVIIFYLLCQKHIINGVASGAVKG